MCVSLAYIWSTLRIAYMYEAQAACSPNSNQMGVADPGTSAHSRQ